MHGDSQFLCPWIPIGFFKSVGSGRKQNLDTDPEIHYFFFNRSDPGRLRIWIRNQQKHFPNLILFFFFWILIRIFKSSNPCHFQKKFGWSSSMKARCKGWCNLHWKFFYRVSKTSLWHSSLRNIFTIKVYLSFLFVKYWRLHSLKWMMMFKKASFFVYQRNNHPPPGEQKTSAFWYRSW